jgi:hypothetical protein
MVEVGGVSGRISLNPSGHAPLYGGYASRAAPLAALTSARVDNGIRSRLWVGRSLGSFQSELPPSQWSSNWLGYTRFDGVFVTAQDMDEAPAEVVQALRQYVTAGGTLVVIGPWQPPADWTHSSLNRHPGVEERYVGLGALWLVEARDPDQVPLGAYRQITRSMGQTARPFRTNRTIEDANRVFPVVEEVRVPVRTLLVLMIVFAVLIGPVNLFVLARKQRRMWMLWTVPAFSLITCLVIWGVNIFAEGFGTDQRTLALTLLDQRTMTATSLGWTAYYAPLAPGDGLRFGRATELTPQIGIHHTTSGWARTLRWSDDQHLESGWIRSRVPAHFRFRRSATFVRERLTFSRQADGTVRVVNGLGAAVERLTYADERGALYTLDRLGAGAGRAMQRARGGRGTVRSTPDQPWRTLDERNWVDTARDLEARPADYLIPNAYVAVLDAAPFVETGLDASEHDARAVILGLVEPPASAP